MTYYDKRDYDLSIPERDEAIKVDPTYLVALSAAGDSFENRRDESLPTRGIMPVINRISFRRSLPLAEFDQVIKM